METGHRALRSLSGPSESRGAVRTCHSNPGLSNLGLDLSFNTGLGIKRADLTGLGCQIHRQFVDLLGNPFLQCL